MRRIVQAWTRAINEFPALLGISIATIVAGPAMLVASCVASEKAMRADVPLQSVRVHSKAAQAGEVDALVCMYDPRKQELLCFDLPTGLDLLRSVGAIPSTPGEKIDL